MADQDANPTAGVEPRGYRRGTLSTDSWDQYVIPVKDRITSFVGRSATFRIAGNAAATQQNLLALINAAGSTVTIAVNRVTIDLLVTAAAGIAPTVVTPAVRVRRATAVSAGTALAKTPRGDSAQTSNASVSCLGGSSADAGTVTAITATNGGLLAQKYAPRLLIVGTTPATTLYEPVDTIPFFYGEPDITLKAGEAMLISLETHAAAGNPATNFWIAEIDWEEYTRP
jgi:hypothetical protein